MIHNMMKSRKRGSGFLENNVTNKEGGLKYDHWRPTGLNSEAACIYII